MWPITEFDPSREALIEPSEVQVCAPGERPPPSGHMGGSGIAPCAVLCFFGDVVERISKSSKATVVDRLVSEHGEHLVYEIDHRGERLAFFQPGVGAPLSAAFFEEAIGRGVRTAVACGAAGALLPELRLGQVVLLTSALRDEGTSYHYLPPSRVVTADVGMVEVLSAALEREGVAFTKARTWSTDGIYRETPEKVRKRREEGCAVVEMEASALFAVARWRGVRFGQLVYAGDSLAGDSWDHREWIAAHEVRERLFWLAADACVAAGHHDSGRVEASSLRGPT